MGFFSSLFGSAATPSGVPSFSSSSIVCPFCFEQFGADAVEYRCTNRQCDAGPSGSAPEVDEKYSTFRGWPRPRPVGHVFKPQKQGHFGGGSVCCDVCHSNTPVPICPSCHSPLPQSSIDGNNEIIAIVGTRGSGKSHYITVLIDQLTRRVGHVMDAGVNPFLTMDGLYNCRELYQETKYKPLFEEQHTLEATSRALGGGDRKDKMPLIYTWNYTEASRGRKKAFTLSFFDAAGEDLEDPQAVATVNRYLQHARGIIFLVDPLQIAGIREQFEAAGETDLTSSLRGVQGTTGFEGVLSAITTLIRTARGIREGDAIDVPVAIAFSKFDQLTPICGAAVTVQQPSPHAKHGAFVEADQQAVDAELRALLENWDEGAIVSSVQSNFRDVAFFGVSALGLHNAPDESGSVKRPRPLRVEDPLLWIMAKNHLITKE